MAEAIWYFDFISPFAYLQFSRFSQLPADLRVTIKPVLFAGLLQHHGHKGPAEIPSKRRFVYRFFKWQAARRGVPFNMPPVHLFNLYRHCAWQLPRAAPPTSLAEYLTLSMGAAGTWRGWPCLSLAESWASTTSRLASPIRR